MAPTLPFEIVAKIIESAYHLHEDLPAVDVKTLSACAAVCKHWCTFTRGLLFFRVNATQQDHGSFLMKFPVLAAPGVGTCIRSLDLYAHRPTSNLDFITALSYCPNLYELRLISRDDAELTESEVVRLKSLHLKIRALALSFVGRTQRDMSLLYQLMTIWPSIQHFTLFVVQGRTPPLPGERPPFALYELALFTCHLPAEPIMCLLLPPIPAGQKGSLRILSFIRTARQDLTPLLDYMPHLRSLRVVSRHSLLQGFLERCGALQELALEVCGVHIESLGLEALVLPATIEHLRILGLCVSEVEAVALVLMRSKLPRLRRVSIDLFNSAPFTFNPYVDLSKVCSGRGVALVPGTSSVRTWTSEYPVPVDRFPRERTIENLYRMNTSD